MSDLFWLSDAQMARLEPYFPKSHGKPRVDDRRVLSGIIFINRNGLRWRDAPAAYGPHKTLYNRWKRWSDKGIFAKMMAGLVPDTDACGVEDDVVDCRSGAADGELPDAFALQPVRPVVAFFDERPLDLGHAQVDRKVLLREVVVGGQSRLQARFDGLRARMDAAGLTYQDITDDPVVLNLVV